MQPEVCYALGRERLRAGNVAEAERLLSCAWAGDRTLTSAAASLARCYAQHGDRFDQAYALLDDAATEGRSLDMLHVVRAEVLTEHGRIEPARLEAQRGMELAKTEATRTAARAALARVYNSEGIELANAESYDQAVFCFKRAADNDPLWSSPHVNIGACFAKLARYTRARDAYQRAARIEPSNAVAHYNLGLLQRHMGDAEASRSAFAAAVDADMGNCDAWVDLGIAMAATGDRDGAETCYRQALDLNPNHESACTRLADLLARDARYIEAALLAERASEIANRKRRRP